MKQITKETKFDEIMSVNTEIIAGILPAKVIVSETEKSGVLNGMSNINGGI